MPPDPLQPNLDAETLDGDLGAPLPKPPTQRRRPAILRIFDPSQGVTEVRLEGERVTIGRGNESDVLLADPYVSRLHAVLNRQEGAWVIADQGSNSGTAVNNQRITSQALKNGDTIQIRDFVLQLREGEDALPEAEEELTPVQKVFKEQYNYLPDSMTIRYREVLVAPARVFAPGDTVVVGEGGILIPARQIRAEDDWILEVEIAWPNNKDKRHFLGEFMGKLPGRRMCVKLHTHQEDKTYAWMETARRGSWIAAAAKSKRR